MKGASVSLSLKPSHEAHAYYRAVILPALLENLHRELKAGFLGMRRDDPSLPSLATFTKEQMTDFLDYAIAAASHMGVQIPEPRKP